MAVVIAGQAFYTAQETCEVLHIKPCTLYAYVTRGFVHSYRQSSTRQRLYRCSEVDALRTPEPADRRHGHRGEIPLAESWIPYTG